MRRMVASLVLGLLLLGAAPRAEAFGWEDVTNGGTAIVKASGQVIVWLDKGLHWSWDTLHNKLVHPAVQVITLGIVNLDQPT